MSPEIPIKPGDTTSIPTVRIRMMEASLRCHSLGLMALIPVIGLPMALMACAYSVQASKHEKYFWNPAKSLRKIGFVCGIIATLTWTVVIALVIWRISNPSAHDSFND